MTLASWCCFSYIKRITFALLETLVLNDLILLSGRKAISRIALDILMILLTDVLYTSMRRYPRLASAWVCYASRVAIPLEHGLRVYAITEVTTIRASSYGVGLILEPTVCIPGLVV